MKQRRARQSADEWARLITRFEKSGLSPVEFCQQEDLSLATFRRWRSRSTTRSPQKSATASSDFIAVKPAATESLQPSPVSSIQLQIGPSITLTIRHEL